MHNEANREIGREKMEEGTVQQRLNYRGAQCEQFGRVLL
jgi:hypothetical protein